MAADPDAWRQELVDAAEGPGSAVLLIARRCVQQLGISGAGASVVSAGSRGIVCATDQRAERVEDLQFTLGVGPCVDAMTDGVAVLVPDVREPVAADAQRWPGFLDAADAAGVRALFSLPLRIGAIRVGALDLHRTDPGPMGVEDLRRAFVAADLMASALVGGDGALAGEEHLAWAGPAYGMHVHQATGMVQAQLDVSTAEALLALRVRAFTEGRTVSELARDVVDRRVRFEQGDVA